MQLAVSMVAVYGALLMGRNSGDARDEAKPDGGKALLFLRGQVGSGRILHFVARKGVKRYLGDGPLMPGTDLSIARIMVTPELLGRAE